MIGTVYSTVLGYEIEVMYAKDISLNYVEKNIEYFNNLDSAFVEKLCAALKRFFDGYYKMNPDLSDYFADDLIEEYDTDPKSILKYIDIGIYYFDEYDVENENVPVLNLSGDCEWDGDRQITILAKDNNLVYVGPFLNYSVWNQEGIEEIRFDNYALPENDD
ncbi:MAG: hypothetical protein OSJ61_16930 [Lachnospiraceae bacterium]|nr:hypothetical protein [Lachnospiraceae bacterium]